MQENKCIEFEKAIFAEVVINPEMQRHVESCRRCSYLQKAVTLSTPNMNTDRADPFAEQVTLIAVQLSVNHAGALARRRKIIPLIIGAIGYLFAICGFLVSYNRFGFDRSSPMLFPDITLLTLPTPNDYSIAISLILTITLILVILITRDRYITVTHKVNGA